MSTINRYENTMIIIYWVERIGIVYYMCILGQTRQMCYFFKYFNVLKLVKITNCTISITKRKKIGHQDLCIIKLPNYFGHVEKN